MCEPLALIAGLTCAAELYRPQWRVLGVGRQVLVADRRRDATLGAIITRLLAVAPLRFALCGLSMGGTLAFELMRRAPERVTRLAVLDATGKPASPDKNAVRIEMIGHAENGRYDHVFALLWPTFVAPARLEDTELRALVRRMAVDTGPETFIRQQRALLDRPDSRPGLAAISVPTRVLVGSEDRLTPVEDSQEIAAGITGSKLMVIPGCGHLSTLEAPEIVTAELSAWLAA
ncbi:MAG: alpha/beta fold hydrolase [Hyphomicrobiales bacterium]|nr:alpha/beta fold hydrolase [Hyphomicrobiales bacterium]